MENLNDFCQLCYCFITKSFHCFCTKWSPESICLLCSRAQKSQHSGWKATSPSRSRTLPAVGPQSQVHPHEFQPMLSLVPTLSLGPFRPPLRAIFLCLSGDLAVPTPRTARSQGGPSSTTSWVSTCFPLSTPSLIPTICLPVSEEVCIFLKFKSSRPLT